MLVATDIAARGIDVEGVTHVVNYDLPNVPESYVHRIGRTARAGAEGQAISFCNDEERAYLRDIERTTRQKVPVAAFPEGFAPPSRQEAQETAAEEARRPPRQPQGRPGQRQGRPGGRGGEGRGEGRGEPRAHEGRGGRPGQPGHRQDQRSGAPRSDAPRPDQRRPERAGEGRPQAARPQGARPQGGRPNGGARRPDGQPARSGGEGGRAIGWLDRAPRS